MILNEIVRPMPIKSIIDFLIAKISDRTIQRAYNRYMADMIYVLAQKKWTDNAELSWGGFEDKMLGKTKTKQPEESLSAEEIIARVKSAHTGWNPG